MKAEWVEQDGAILLKGTMIDNGYNENGFRAYLRLDIPPDELLNAISKGEIESFRFRLTDALLEFAHDNNTWMKLMPQMASLGRKR